MSIKSRRLFAILVITAMVLAMLPVTAWASGSGKDYSAAASYVVVDKTSVKADGADKATITLIPREGNGAVIKSPDYLNAGFWVKSSRDAETIEMKATSPASVTLNAVDLGSATGAAVSAGVEPTADGEIKFEVVSSIAGEAKISFYTAPANNPAKLLIGEVTITFTADPASIHSVTLAVKDNNNINNITSQAVGTNITLNARVLDAQFNGIAGETVTFSVQKGTGSWATIGTAISDALGRASIKYTTTVAGNNYNFRAKAGDKDETISNFSFTALAPTKIEFVTEASVFESGTGKKATLEVKQTDMYGNKTITSNPVISVPVYPSDLAAAPQVTGEQWTTDNNYYKFEVETTKAGEYKVRAAISGTGIFAEKTFTAQKKGEPVSLEVKLPTNKQSLKAGLTTPDAIDLTVNEVDAAGIKIAATRGDYVMSSSDVTLATIDTTSTTNFTVKATSDAKKSGVVTITIMHKTKNVSGKIEIPVVGDPVALTATPKVDGLNAEVTLQLVDANGYPSYASDVMYTVFKGALSITEQGAFGGTTGKATLKLAASEYGTYNVTVVTNTGIARTFSLTFKAPPAPKPGAKSVTMFIGAKGYVQDGAGMIADIAPFIQDGRTFVPVRFLAEAFAAEADWTPKDAAVEVVTLTRDDIQITINIGSYVINVVKDGVAETVTSDVAAFIKDGRTVLPFRVIAEAFGAEVDYGPKDGPIEWVTFKQ